MMGSLFSSISGLKNHTTWMNVIGNNISNVNTVGFKQSRVTFKDAVSQSIGAASGANNTNNLGGINPKQSGLGSVLGSIDTIMTQGSISTTGNDTDVAIDGNGFFVVESGDKTMYTRAGNFNFDNQGNLVTSSGGLVQGWQVMLDRTGAAPTIISQYPAEINTSVPYGSIQIPRNMVLGPQQTGNANTFNVANPSAAAGDKQHGIILKGNLDSMTPMNETVRLDATIYDSLGNERLVSFIFTQTMDTAAGQDASWDWNAYDLTTTNGVLPTPLPAAIGTGTALTFNTDGSLESDTAAGNPIPEINLVALNGAAAFAVSVNFGTENNIPAAGDFGLRDGLTGDFGGGTTDPITGVYLPKHTIYFAGSDGYTEGTLTGVSVDITGGINCRFSNNQIITMGKLALANFANASGLDKVGGTMFMQSANSGLPQVSTAGNAGLGTITGMALEASNVDLSVELTNMIIAQRGFESNARIITTSSDMLDTLVQLGR